MTNKDMADKYEIVRCNRCKYYDNEYNWCDYLDISLGGNGFCSEGEAARHIYVNTDFVEYNPYYPVEDDWDYDGCGSKEAINDDQNNKC